MGFFVEDTELDLETIRQQNEAARAYEAARSVAVGVCGDVNSNTLVCVAQWLRLNREWRDYRARMQALTDAHPNDANVQDAARRSLTSRDALYDFEAEQALHDWEPDYLTPEQ